MRCVAVRAERCETREALAARGALRPLVHQGEGWFRVTADDVEIEASGFDRWLIVRDTPTGLAAQVRFNDWAHRARSWGGRAEPEFGIGRVSEVDKNPVGFARRLHIEWIHRPDPPLEDAAHALLMPTYLDFNTDKVLAGLARVDEGDGLFVQLLNDPPSAATLPPRSGALADDGSTFDLTSSQADAWQTVAASRVTAIWGPPGTGKTHLLAALILGFCAAFPGRQHRCRILVSAMTHAAIDNLLRKVVQLARTLGRPIPVIGKVGGTRYDTGGNVEAIDQVQVDGWLRDHDIAVLGRTYLKIV